MPIRALFQRLFVWAIYDGVPVGNSLHLIDAECGRVDNLAIAGIFVRYFSVICTKTL